MSKKLKIAFFSAWPFGLRGTPGTYRFIEKMLEYSQLLVFAPIAQKDVVFFSRRVPIIPVKSLFKHRDIKDSIIPLKHFDPDIIYIFNYPEWYKLVDILKRKLPQKKIIFDIKTPLLPKGNKRQKIQEKGTLAQKHLDAIVTLSTESVKTWLPEYTHSPIVYPLGIDFSLFRPDFSVLENKNSLRFVFIGTLHPKRQIDVLIHAFKDFVDQSKKAVILDIYGGGPDLKRLEDMVLSFGMEKHIRLQGLKNQDDLIQLLPEYDAGIAWVPYENYDASPSLKSLEYMASGLTILASDTRAHKALVDQNFKVDLFSNNKESIVNALHKACANGFFKKHAIQNIKAVKKHDYGFIIRNYHFKLFKQLNNSDSIEPKSFKLDIKIKQKSNNGSSSELPVRLYKPLSVSSSKRHLKIMILCSSLSLGKGGAERVATELANEMSLRGHLVYLAYKDNGIPAYSTYNNIVLIPYHSDSKFRQLIISVDPDVFFAFYFNRDLINYYALVHDTQIPFAMQECTNPDRLCFRNWPLGGVKSVEAVWEREMIASAAARIRMVMPGYENSFPEYIRYKIRAFANPCFPQSQKAFPAEFVNGRKTIININGFKQNKNLITLVKAFARIAPSFPEWDIKVLGVAADADIPHKKEILDFIKENQLKHRIFICGQTDDIFTEYASAHVHVIASLSEGCPTCILEAMSMGLPSIGFSDCPGTKQLISHGENGLLASSDDRVEGMEIALKQYMASPELQERLGYNALQDSKAFIPQKIYDQWEALFFEAAEYKGGLNRLFREQMAIDREKASHAHRMKDKIGKILNVCDSKKSKKIT